MIYLAHYNTKTGEILERRPKGDDSYRDSIPEPFVELSEEQFQASLNGDRVDLEALEKGETKLEPYSPPPPTLDELKTRKQREVWAAGDAVMAALRSNFTRTEQDGFIDQRQGAIDLKANRTDTREAKLVAAIATRRGVEISALVEKILHNVAVADYVGAAVIGEQQRLDDQVKAATTAEQLEAITWTLTLKQFLAGRSAD